MAGPIISHRVSLQWIPNAPFEDTDTIVLASRNSHLVDLRVYKDQSNPNGPLEWGMTGRENPISEEPRVIEFIHDISTHDLPNYHGGKYDRSTFVDLPDGTCKEFGVMKNFATGELEAPYNEIWTTLDPLAGDENGYVTKLEENGDDVKCVVTKVDQTKQTQYLGSVMRLGNFFQGVLLNKETGKYSAKRYFLKNGEWIKKFEVGEEVDKLPLIDSGKVNKEFQFGEIDWIIVESDN